MVPICIPPWVNAHIMVDHAQVNNTVAALRADVQRLHAELAMVTSDHKHREREMQRQLRNILSVIRSIVHRTGAEADSIESYEMLLDGRISAFARVQSLLLFDPVSGVDLFSMFADEALAAGLRDDAILYEGNSVYISAQAANTLALIAHELMLAAAGHDLSESVGTLVHLHQQIEPSAGVNSAALIIDWKQYWTDEDSQSSAFGWLAEALSYDVHGEIQTFPWAHGTCRRFIMPIETALAPASLSSA